MSWFTRLRLDSPMTQYIFIILCILAAAVLPLACHKPVLREVPPVRDVPEDAVPEVWATDGAEEGAIGAPLPAKPFKGQKKPPCKTDPKDATIYTELVGGCWLKAAQLPPCGSLYESQGACYMPVKEGTPPRTSIEH